MDRWLERGSQPTWSGPRAPGRLELYTNITGQEETEETLRENQFQYRTLVENGPDASYVQTEERLAFVNKAAVRLYGAASAEDLVGRPVLEMIHPDFHDSVRRRMHLLGAGKTSVPVVEEKHVRLNGTILDVEVNSVAIRYGESDGELVHIRDITARRRGEEEKRRLAMELKQARRMEAIGTLAGGVAHDFNNILAAIFGYTEIALEEVDEDAPVRRSLEQILKSAHRARDLIRQILIFSRMKAGQPLRPVKIGVIVNEALKLFCASIPASIKVRRHIIEEDDIGLADPSQIPRVVTNLCLNAVHAMEAKGGTLEVTLTRFDPGPDTLPYSPSIPPCPCLKLTVSDSGHGMDPDTMERIFDPYFTTKPPDQGSGLGLAVVQGIVKRHEGAIEVRSKPFEGSTFAVYLPRLSGETERKGYQVQPLPGGRERILLVDDEAALAEVGKRTLEALGYEVVSGTDGTRALELFRQDPGRFDLVITDYTMPEIVGTDLALEMMRLRPELPVILCTGFSEKSIQEKAKEIGVRQFLLKPVDRRELAFAVRRALDGRRGRR